MGDRITKQSNQSNQPKETTMTTDGKPRTGSLELHSAKLSGLKGWVAWSFWVKESPYGNYYQMVGAVCPLYVRGENKGKPNYRAADLSTRKTIDITPQQHQEFIDDWELKNNQCMNCLGTGQEWAGSSVEHGRTYRECRYCKGTGKPS